MREDLYEEAFARMKKAAGVSGTANCNLTKNKKDFRFQKLHKLFRLLHSGAKCLVWVKKCCHVWLDQNFDPSLLTNKL